MGSPSLTQRLIKAAERGQEIVAVSEGAAVVHAPRNESDPKPWVSRGLDGAQMRHGAAECFARLALPLPSGTVLEHTLSGKRGLFAGPAPMPWAVLVEFHAVKGQPQIVEISRSLLRRAS